MLGEGLPARLAAEKFFQHLRRHFDEVALDGEAAVAGPALLAAEDVVHQVAELVEEGDDVVVLHQAGIVRRFAAGEVTDQHALGELAAADAGDQRGAENHLSLPWRGCMSR